MIVIMRGLWGMNMFDIEGIPAALNGGKVCQDDAIRTNKKAPNDVQALWRQ